MAAGMPDLGMDAQSMYREEVFTDRRIGSIRKLTPIMSDGTTDQSRKIIYTGQAQLMTPAGALPLGFEIEADDLAGAIAQFGRLAQEALERTAKELEEMRRDAQSSIVVPGGGGGGNIQMP